MPELDFASRATHFLQGAGVATVRAVTALAVAYVFLVSLMTAAAQQQVVTQLTALEGPQKIDFSTALAKVKDAERSRQRLGALQAKATTLNETEAGSARALLQASDAADDAWRRFKPTFDHAARNGCDLTTPAPVGYPQEYAAWNEVADCGRDGTVPPRFQAAIKEAMEAKRGFADAYNAWELAKSTSDTNDSAVKSIAAQEVVETNAVNESDRLRSAFSEMDVLRDNWMLGGGILTDFPPTLLHIILAFSSGAFGALLVTLIPVVYPHSQVAAASREYLARILLGGLISVCIYVFLAGGSAVLGNATPLSEGQANVMTFCAVGVLSGMFSDRAASLAFSARQRLLRPDGRTAGRQRKWPCCAHAGPMNAIEAETFAARRRHREPGDDFLPGCSSRVYPRRAGGDQPLQARQSGHLQQRSLEEAP